MEFNYFKLKQIKYHFKWMEFNRRKHSWNGFWVIWCGVRIIIKFCSFLEYLKSTISKMIAGASRGRRCTYGDIRRFTCADISVDLHRGSLFEGVSRNYSIFLPKDHIFIKISNKKYIYMFVNTSNNNNI